MTEERILPGDPLHWTGTAQNWNHTCAECHSTNLQKNYNLAADTYHTTFSEIDVSCEACHGPGSLHVDLAESWSPFWDRNHGYGLVSLKGETAANQKTQIETCAACHARRANVHPSFKPGDDFLDDFDPALLQEGLYHADGQILDEVYVYGSFLQSRMHAEGVRCTDCHDPHSLELKFEGNKLCTECHQPGKYDTFSHHHHKEPAGTQCVACHMRSQTYMVLDDRRDHSFRIPRPELTEQIGTPNACNDCHEEPASWATKKIRQWTGTQEEPAKMPFDVLSALALDAGRKGKKAGEQLLIKVIGQRRTTAQKKRPSDLTRASAVALLAKYQTANSNRVIHKAVTDPSPLVRLSAVRAVTNLSPSDTRKLLAPLLTDKVRAVRSIAALRLANVPKGFFGKDDRKALALAMDEFKQAQSMALDRAAAHMNLGQLYAQAGDFPEAAKSYRNAVRREPYLTGPRAQFAATLEHWLSDKLAMRTSSVKEIQAVRTEAARLRAEELINLARDTKLLPNNSVLRYDYGKALFQAAKHEEAIVQIAKACTLDQNAYIPRLDLALLYEKKKKWKQAIGVLQEMDTLRPGDRNAKAIRERIWAAQQLPSNSH